MKERIGEKREVELGWFWKRQVLELANSILKSVLSSSLVSQFVKRTSAAISSRLQQLSQVTRPCEFFLYPHSQ